MTYPNKSPEGLSWNYEPTVWFDSCSHALCFSIRRVSNSYPRVVQVLKNEGSMLWWTDAEAGALIGPVCSISETAAQYLLNRLLDSGVKPETMIESEGQKKALEDNLRDLRKVVDATMGTKLCAS